MHLYTPKKTVCNVLALYETREYSIYYAKFITTLLRCLSTEVCLNSFYFNVLPQKYSFFPLRYGRESLDEFDWPFSLSNANNLADLLKRTSEGYRREHVRLSQVYCKAI